MDRKHVEFQKSLSMYTREPNGLCHTGDPPNGYPSPSILLEKQSIFSGCQIRRQPVSDSKFGDSLSHRNMCNINLQSHIYDIDIEYSIIYLKKIYPIISHDTVPNIGSMMFIVFKHWFYFLYPNDIPRFPNQLLAKTCSIPQAIYPMLYLVVG